MNLIGNDYGIKILLTDKGNHQHPTYMYTAIKLEVLCMGAFKIVQNSNETTRKRNYHMN